MIVVLEGSTALLPVWVERRNLNEPHFEHRGARLLPFICVGQVEDEQVFRCGSWRHWMGATVGELKVVVQLRSTKHDAVETVVVFEPSNLHEVKPFAVHDDRAIEGADWPSYSELGLHDPGKWLSGLTFAFSGARLHARPLRRMDGHAVLFPDRNSSPSRVRNWNQLEI